MRSAHELCAVELHLPGGRKAFFSPAQKGSVGMLQPGGQDWSSQGMKQRVRVGGAMGKAEEQPGSDMLGGSPPGDS